MALYNENQDLGFKLFKLDYLRRHAIIAMVAKRNSGKSFAVRHILKHLSVNQGIPGGIIIAPTDEEQQFYSDFVPDLYIHYKFENSILGNLFHRQKIVQEKRRKYAKKGKRVDARVFLVMDDCLDSKGAWSKDELIKKIFFNGRHHHITFILTMQFPLGIQPELRSNIDYVFLLANNIQSDQKRLYDHYAGVFPNFNMFKTVFAELTKDYGCMVIATGSNSNDLMDVIYHFKASNWKDKKFIGCKQYHEMHKMNFDSNWKKNKADKGLDVNILAGPRKNKSFKVVKKD